MKWSVIYHQKQVAGRFALPNSKQIILCNTTLFTRYMQVYSQVGLLERPYFFTNPDAPLPTRTRLYRPGRAFTDPDAPGRGQAPPLLYYESSCQVSHPGWGQAPSLHFFVFTFDGVVAVGTALVSWCILLCTTKV